MFHQFFHSFSLFTQGIPLYSTRLPTPCQRRKNAKGLLEKYAAEMRLAARDSPPG